MENIVEKNIEKIKSWLSQDVYPLWQSRGIDHMSGGFVETLGFDKSDLGQARRAMVQSRQIYSFLTGARMGCFPKDQSALAVVQGTHYLMECFSAESGAFIYSINPDGSPKVTTPDLYTQAFALFGLAQAYSLNPETKTKDRAKKILSYLKRERQVSGGGYTELDEKGNASFKSNPHMHLFESAVAWMQIDPDPEWKELGHELITLCLTKFIDPETQVLGEYFDENWQPLRENGKFIYEPGHQYEWAWLMSLYEDLTQQNLKDIRHRLFKLAEKHGTSSQRKIAFDEMWSDFKPKALTSRFWPQGERIKAAARLGTEVPKGEQSAYAKAADDAMETLFKFLETPTQGMWYDRLSETDTFEGNSSKSSSLYHIINAMEEYVNYRPKLI